MTIAGFPRGVPLPTWPGMPNRTLDQEATAPNVTQWDDVRREGG